MVDSVAYGSLYLSMTVERNKVLKQQLREVSSTHGSKRSNAPAR